MAHIGIPVIDLFAGPGGLGEGFAAVRDRNRNRVFDLRISIEKDPFAHQTLTLRALYRKLANDQVPDVYYDYIRGSISKEEFYASPLIASALQHARQEAHCLELGKHNEQIDPLIRQAVKGHDKWVLIGGPPCQAYSVAGRARRRNEDLKTFEADPKHFLYRQYLRIIRDHQPAVFVMENVKGMLSSEHSGQRIFQQIMRDLTKPGPGIFYDIRSFVVDSRKDGLQPHDFLIEAERYGIPQMRHRVILLGIRRDLSGLSHELLAERDAEVHVREVLAGLPKLRSRLSKEPDSHEAWLNALHGTKAALKGWRSPMKNSIEELIVGAAADAWRHKDFGSSFIAKEAQPSHLLPSDLFNWLHDPRLGGVCQHEARRHMRSDLQRYLFASCFAKRHKYSPKLALFPPNLLPKHKNIEDEKKPFDDRFRVQVYKQPSTTIVSHISKDGHYYIHPDPSQCRTLTVREAARLQTFPDNYFFEGTRTHQYHQVGNAVPPFLANQLGITVASFLNRSLQQVPQRTVLRQLLLTEV